MDRLCVETRTFKLHSWDDVMIQFRVCNIKHEPTNKMR